METVTTIGRRKTAIARIYLNEGKGNISINNKDFKEYFPLEHIRHTILKPLELISSIGIYDIRAILDGGGFTGQAKAIQLAIARALVKVNPENKHIFRVNGLLTRDPREVERKKPGKKKARKRFQYSKR
ncbi:MAG: 30S ribosomal protein S9 [Bacteroidia bacterium]|nr:30S ribosomal protein S9 [Bacteroidia bacterium]